MMTKNPLLTDYITPPFDAIKPEHYKPAIEARLADIGPQVAVIKAKAASFANTAVLLERLFHAVEDVQFLLANTTSNAYTPELSAIEGEIDVIVSNAMKSVFQDRDLGLLFDQVYERRDDAALGGDDRTILRDLYWQFESAGAFLDAAGQEKIRALDAAMLRQAQIFRDNMQAAPLQAAVLVTDRAELAGLSDAEIATLEKQARDNGRAKGWLFIPERLLVDEWLEKAENPEFRRKIVAALNAIGSKAPYDNEPVIWELQRLRQEFATLLGYPNFASFARTRTMLGLEDADALLDVVAAAALPKFEEEMRALEAFAGQKLGAADVDFWAAKQADALFGFDAQAFAQYLPLDAVLAGLMEEAGLVGGFTSRETTGNHPTLHTDIRTYDIIDTETGDISILHLDLFARPGLKVGGAWMNTIQMGGGKRPRIIIFNMNFAPAADGQMPTIALGQLTTTYHEMGHALQGLIARAAKYRSLNNVYGPSDFIEIHSMINEPRATDRAALARYARHVKTGVPPDAAALTAMEKSKTHFRSRDLLKIVENSRRDLAFHRIAPPDYQGTRAVEKSVAFDSEYQPHVRSYAATRFTHLFDSGRGGYCAGYVNYLIAFVHAADGAEAFGDDLRNPEWLARLRLLYAPPSGDFGDWLGRYRAYRGRDATADALLREAGIGV